jgi:hypothetical protein
LEQYYCAALPESKVDKSAKAKDDINKRILVRLLHNYFKTTIYCGLYCRNAHICGYFASTSVINFFMRTVSSPHTSYTAWRKMAIIRQN